MDFATKVVIFGLVILLLAAPMMSWGGWRAKVGKVGTVTGFALLFAAFFV